MAEIVLPNDNANQQDMSAEISGKKVKWLNNQCNICTGKNPVSGYCGLCDDFLCTNCETAHKGGKTTHKHPILNGHDMPGEKLAAGNFCSKHEHEILTEFCNDHNDSFCSICIKDSHLQCNRDDIEKLSTDYKTKQEYCSVATKMKDVQDTIDSLENMGEQKLSCMETKFDAVLENISDFCETIEQNLDSMKQRAMSIAENERKNIRMEISSSTDYCTTARKKMKEISEQLQNLEKYGLDYHLVLSTKRAQNNVALIEKELTELTRKNETLIVDYRFQRHGGIEAALSESTDLGDMIIDDDSDNRSSARVNENSTESMEAAFASAASNTPSTINLRKRNAKPADNADKDGKKPPKAILGVMPKYRLYIMLCGCILFILLVSWFSIGQQ